MSEQEAVRSRLLRLAGSAQLRGDVTVFSFEPFMVHGSFVGAGGRNLTLDGLSPGEAGGKLRDFVAREKQVIAARKLKRGGPGDRGKKEKGHSPSI